MDRWERLTRLVTEALSLEGSERQRFLSERCGDDSVLRAEVESLLAHEDGALLRSSRGPFVEPEPSSAAREPEAPSGTTSPSAPSTQPTLAESPRRHPFLAVCVLLAALIVLEVSTAVFVLVRSGGTRRDFGWGEGTRGRDSVVRSVRPDGPAAGHLERGDVVLGLDGVPALALAGTRLHRRELETGDGYVLTIRRGDERREVPLVVGSSERSLHSDLAYLLLGLVWGSVGLMIGFIRPDRPVARLSTLSAVATAHVFLQIGVLQWGVNVAPLHVILGLHFFARFPTGEPLRRPWRIALGALYAAGGAFPLLATAASLTARVTGPAAVAGIGDLLVAARLPMVVAANGAVLGILVAIPYNYRCLTEADLKRRVRWMAFGSLVGLAPVVLYNAVWLATGDVGPGLSLFTNASSVVVPVCMAYVVLKHRVLDIRVVVRRGLQYLLARRALQAAVALPVAALAWSAVENRHRTLAELATEGRGFAVWLVAAGLALRFRTPIRQWLDRRFFAEEYDRERLLLDLVRDLGRVDSLSELARLVTARLTDALHPIAIYLWYRDPAELASASSTDPALTPRGLGGGAWMAWLERSGSAASLPLPAEAGVSERDGRWLDAHGVRVAVPILDSGERLVGALLLGERASEEPYSPGDQHLLEAVGRQMAVVRENLRLRARVSDDARVRHDVLARLDGRLPGLLKECPSCGRCYDGDAERCDRDGETLTLALPISRVVDDKYRLDRLIGRGGMGAVYAAHDLRLGRSVAVKCLLGRQFGQQGALRRFRREARAAARLSHRNIVAVYDYGVLEGEGAYLVMELLEGETLRSELRRAGQLDGPRAAEWFEPVLDGLGAAHGHDMIHRDLKPENVIGENGETLEVRILDLGLVKFGSDESISSDPLTAEGAVMGTFAYMAPEQLAGRPVDRRADIFAVGVMLVEALTGRHPFRDPDDSHARARRLGPFRVTGTTPDSERLAALLGCCLAADPEQRLGSAVALKRELAPLLREAAQPFELKLEPA